MTLALPLTHRKELRPVLCGVLSEPRGDIGDAAEGGRTERQDILASVRESYADDE